MSDREAAVAKARADAPDASETLARRVAAMADEKLGEDIVILDMRELVSYTDFLVLVTARNERLAKAIADDVHLQAERRRACCRRGWRACRRRGGCCSIIWIAFFTYSCRRRGSTTASSSFGAKLHGWSSRPRSSVRSAA